VEADWRHETRRPTPRRQADGQVIGSLSAGGFMPATATMVSSGARPSFTPRALAAANATVVLASSPAMPGADVQHDEGLRPCETELDATTTIWYST